MSNFIKNHLIAKIKIMYKDYDRNMSIQGNDRFPIGTYGWSEGKFLYLDTEIKNGNREINRINEYSLFYKGDINSIGWYALSGPQIIQIWDQLKNNKVHIFKNIDGKSYKIRKKT